MAQSKSSPPNRSGSSKSGGASGSKAPGGRGTPPRKPPAKGKGKGKSIVNQKQRPWGLIASATAVVIFAVAVVAIVIVTRKSDTTGGTSVSAGGQSVDTKDSYRQPALAAAMAIDGVTYKVEGEHDHVAGTVKYDSSPPVGGNHSQIWADCTGKVYSKQIANENAVHALEHGAVWVAYNPNDLSAAQIAVLAKDVQGVDRALLTPYAGLKTPISLQAWGYQLFLSDPADARVEKFITTLSGNPKTWPEQGATCSDPAFVPADSTPGHPQENA